MRDAGKLPMGQLPVLRLGDTVLPQSCAIARYAAKCVGLPESIAFQLDSSSVRVSGRPNTPSWVLLDAAHGGVLGHRQLSALLSHTPSTLPSLCPLSLTDGRCIQARGAVPRRAGGRRFHRRRCRYLARPARPLLR
jgi:hypothetical protein